MRRVRGNGESFALTSTKTDAGASATLAKRLTKAKQQSSYPGEMYQIIPTALIDETIAALDSSRSTDSGAIERLAALGKLTIEKLSHAVELRGKFAPLLDKAVGYSIAFTAKEVEKALAELQPSTTPPEDGYVTWAEKTPTFAQYICKVDDSAPVDIWQNITKQGGFYVIALDFITSKWRTLKRIKPTAPPEKPVRASVA
jgi:hypothetical protein